MIRLLFRHVSPEAMKRFIPELLMKRHIDIPGGLVDLPAKTNNFQYSRFMHVRFLQMANILVQHIQLEYNCIVCSQQGLSLMSQPIQVTATVSPRSSSS